jgi:ATP-dependent DNA helicase RecG
MFQAPLSETSRARLAILREHQDGFIIAEKDLLLRGPGDIMGTRQTGQIPLIIADLSRDQDLIEPVQQAAEIILQQHPENVRPIIDRWLKDDRYFSEV